MLGLPQDHSLGSYPFFIMSQVSSSHMGQKSSLTCSIPSETNGNHPWGYGGTIPEHFTDQQYFNNTVRKKSNVRLNDQLIPKPTDINVADKMSKMATPKEHPFSSHISRFAMFPSFRSPDDPETGVRAASQPFLNLHLPNCAPEVILQSKSIGGPYRHEILETPMKSRKKAVTWTGDHGFMDHPKPLRGEKQVFYPTPPKTVMPNPKLRDWDLSLSERTSNMLKNLERTHWLTSYQMHYTGSGPANPLKMDDFQEKMSNLPGINSHTAPLLERSHPVFVPSKPNQGCRRSQGSPVRRSTCSPTPELRKTNPALNHSTAPAAITQPQEITSLRNEAPHADQKCLSQSENSTGFAGAGPADLSPGIIHKQELESKRPVCEGRRRKVQFDESLLQRSVSQNCQEGNAAQISRTEQHLNLPGHPHTRAKDVQGSENESRCSQLTTAKEKANLASDAGLFSSEQELQHIVSSPCVLKRPPVLPGIFSVDQVGIMGTANSAVSILDLQNSFSKSEAHRKFNSSITRAAVNLRDNVVSGKKHDFYGINCNYIHG